MVRIFRFLFLCLWMLLFPAGLLRAEEGDDVLARMIHFSKEKCGRACAVLHLDLLNTSETYRYGGTLQRQDTEKSICHVPR